MRIVGISVCYNEEKLLPFFLDYYTRICDDLIIFDGNSTDNSIDIIRSYMKRTKCNIELRIFQTIGQLDYFDFGHLVDHWNYNWNVSQYYIKGYAYQTLFSKAYNDWIMVFDIDEFLYHPIGLRQRLKQLKEQSVTLPCIQGFDMISDTFPKFTEGLFLVDMIKSGFWSQDQTKQLIYSAQDISDMCYAPGCHHHKAEGRIQYDSDTPFIDQIKKLHFRYLGYDYFINRAYEKDKNNSISNLERGLSVHYKSEILMNLQDYNKLRDVDTYHENVFTAVSSKKPNS